MLERGAGGSGCHGGVRMLGEPWGQGESYEVPWGVWGGNSEHWEGDWGGLGA